MLISTNNNYTLRLIGSSLPVSLYASMAFNHANTGPFKLNVQTALFLLVLYSLD